jgi:hypothetical protein
MVREREPRDPEEGGFIPDMIRRTIERSVNAVLHSEDERRRFFSALLPRDFMNNVAAQVDSTKRDAVAMIGREMQQFLQQLNVGDEIKKILTSVSFEVATTVRFVPNDEGGLKPEIKRSSKPIVNSQRSKKKPVKKAAKPRKKPPVVAELPPGVKRRGRVQRVVDAIGETAEMIVGGRDPEDDDDFDA